MYNNIFEKTCLGNLLLQSELRMNIQTTFGTNNISDFNRAYQENF